MGRKTFESLGKPLPNRTNIIISRNKNYNAKGCKVVNSLTAALEAANKDDDPFILGGAQIFIEAMDVTDVLDITLIDHEFEADVYFPEIDKNIWKETSRKDCVADSKNKYDYSFISYKRIK